jgi:hypothetical protein
MSGTFTFTTLKETVRSYIQRGSATYDPDTDTQIPIAINLTENRIARELKIQGFQRAVTSVFQPSLGVYRKPDRWRETISINVGTNVGTATTYNRRVNIRELSYESMNNYWPDRTQTGAPKFYADYNYINWLFVPTPSAAIPWEAMIWELPPFLTDANQTNYLSDFAPNALLHGTLDEMFGWLRNDGEKEKWKTEYDRDMAALSGEDLQKIIDRNYKRATS